MYRGSKPRIVPLLIAVVVIGLLIAGLVSLGRLIFLPNSSSNQQSKSASQPVLQDEVLKTTADRSVRYTVRGSLVADENFRSYQITISPTERTIVEYKGYLSEVTNTRTFGNNFAAYDEFVHALSNADIGKTRSISDDDMRGVCATNGRLYQFETLAEGKTTRSIWTSTCSGSPGTMTAKISQVHALFVNQIPDFKPMFDKVY